MKTIKFTLLFSFIFLFPLCMNAQSEWAPIGTQWVYSMHDTFRPDIEINTLTSIGDTVINGQLCRQMKWENFTCNFRRRMEFMYEDSSRIYHFNEDANAFELLYDFNKEAGESWLVPSWFEIRDVYTLENIDTVEVRVDSVGEIVLNNQTYKVQYVSHIVGPVNTETIIENIGSISDFSMFEYGLCDSKHNFELRCHTVPDEDVISFVNSECLTIAVEEVDELEEGISIHPNPFNDQLHIDFQQHFAEDYEVQIFAASGQLVYQNNVIGYDATLDLSSLSTGVYFLTIVGKEGRGPFFKLVKY